MLGCSLAHGRLLGDAGRWRWQLVPQADLERLALVDHRLALRAHHISMGDDSAVSAMPRQHHARNAGGGGGQVCTVHECVVNVEQRERTRGEESRRSGKKRGPTQHRTCNDERSMLMSRSRLAISMREFCSAICICALIHPQSPPPSRQLSPAQRIYHIVSPCFVIGIITTRKAAR